MMKTRIGMNVIWGITLLLIAVPPAHGKNNIFHIQAKIEHYVKAAAQVENYSCGSGIEKVADWVFEFYTRRNYSPAWIDEIGLKSDATILINTIRDAGKDGLPQEAYPIDLINQLTASAIFMTANGRLLAPELAAHLDMTLSTTFFLHSIYLSEGRLETDYLQGTQRLVEFPTQVVYDLERALETHTLSELLTNLIPHKKYYEQLKIAKEQYELIVAAGGWPEIPKGPKLEKGIRNDRVRLLRARLKITEDLVDSADVGSDHFDDDLQKAVEHFQKRHGLFVDGIVGTSTLKTLNIPAEVRLGQIVVNLERWRLLPRNFGERYIEVNIPDFRLKLVNNGHVVQTMRVVVGRRNRPTPIFAGRITYLEINPYWTVPPRIAKKDLLPKIQQDPSYLTRQKIRVFENWKASAAELDPLSIDWSQIGDNHFPYKLRQEPNQNNALGQVKFMFPNKLNVYLHDTPAKDLFQRQQRSFSSGCVRVENPLDLATYLLNADHGWDRQKISRILEKGTPEVVLLKDPIPIYLLYWTAWADEDGIIHFREDIYGRDKALNQLLKKQLPVFRTCQKGLIPKPLIVSGENHTKASPTDTSSI